MMTAEHSRRPSQAQGLLAEYERADTPFEYQAACIDKFVVDGHRELAEIGRHRQHVIPWS